MPRRSTRVNILSLKMERRGLEVSSSGLRGINSSGHSGWTTTKCRICALKIDITMDITYICTHCVEKYEAYFCPADAKRLHYRCPFCDRELVPYTPWIIERRGSSR